MSYKLTEEEAKALGIDPLTAGPDPRMVFHLGDVRAGEDSLTIQFHDDVTGEDETADYPKVMEFLKEKGEDLSGTILVEALWRAVEILGDAPTGSGDAVRWELDHYEIEVDA